MLSMLVIVLAILLLVAIAFIFFTVGVTYGMQGVVKRLKDKGWTIEPPEDVNHE